MELDGRIDREDDGNTSDGEIGRVVEEMVRTILCCSFNINQSNNHFPVITVL